MGGVVAPDGSDWERQVVGPTGPMLGTWTPAAGDYPALFWPSPRLAQMLPSVGSVQRWSTLAEIADGLREADRQRRAA